MSYRPENEARTVALVLDTTAVLAYAAGVMHVHEPLAGWPLAGRPGVHQPSG